MLVGHSTFISCAEVDRHCGKQLVRRVVWKLNGRFDRQMVQAEIKIKL